MSSYKVLRDFGFSQTALACYEDLFEHGGASAGQLAERSGKPRASLYRALRQLEAKGFVTAVKTEGQPSYFYATPVETALRRYIDYQWRAAGKLIDEQADTLARRAGKHSRRWRSGPSARPSS